MQWLGLGLIDINKLVVLDDKFILLSIDNNYCIRARNVMNSWEWAITIFDGELRGYTIKIGFDKEMVSRIGILKFLSRITMFGLSCSTRGDKGFRIVANHENVELFPQKYEQQFRNQDGYMQNRCIQQVDDGLHIEDIIEDGKNTPIHSIINGTLEEYVSSDSKGREILNQFNAMLSKCHFTKELTEIIGEDVLDQSGLSLLSTQIDKSESGIQMVKSASTTQN